MIASPFQCSIHIHTQKTHAFSCRLICPAVFRSVLPVYDKWEKNRLSRSCQQYVLGIVGGYKFTYYSYIFIRQSHSFTFHRHNLIRMSNATHSLRSIAVNILSMIKKEKNGEATFALAPDFDTSAEKNYAIFYSLLPSKSHRIVSIPVRIEYIVQLSLYAHYLEQQILHASIILATVTLKINGQMKRRNFLPKHLQFWYILIIIARSVNACSWQSRPWASGAVMQRNLQTDIVLACMAVSKK